MLFNPQTTTHPTTPAHTHLLHTALYCLFSIDVCPSYHSFPYKHFVMCKGLITLCVVSLEFLIFPRVFFSCKFFLEFFIPTFWYQKCKKNTRKLADVRKKRDLFSILHYALGKNASQLRFFSDFGTFEVTKTQTQRIM